MVQRSAFAHCPRAMSRQLAKDVNDAEEAELERPAASGDNGFRSSQSAALVQQLEQDALANGKAPARGCAGPGGGGSGACAAGDRVCRAQGITQRDKEVQARDEDRPEAARGLDSVGGCTQDEKLCRRRRGQEGVEGGVQFIRWRLCLFSCRCRDGERQDGRRGHVGRLLRARGPWRVREMGDQIVWHAQEGGCAGSRCKSKCQMPNASRSTSWSWQSAIQKHDQREAWPSTVRHGIMRSNRDSCT